MRPTFRIIRPAYTHLSDHAHPLRRSRVRNPRRRRQRRPSSEFAGAAPDPRMPARPLRSLPRPLLPLLQTLQTLLLLLSLPGDDGEAAAWPPGLLFHEPILRQRTPAGSVAAHLCVACTVREYIPLRVHSCSNQTTDHIQRPPAGSVAAHLYYRMHGLRVHSRSNQATDHIRRRSAPPSSPAPRRYSGGSAPS